MDISAAAWEAINAWIFVKSFSGPFYPIIQFMLPVFIRTATRVTRVNVILSPHFRNKLKTKGE